jgi:hypothetical protein
MASEKPIDLAELLRDAESCTRFSEWEQRFVDELRGKFLMRGGQMTLSEKQIAVLRKIEKVIYAAG